MQVSVLEAVEERRVNRQVVNHSANPPGNGPGLGLALPGLGGRARRRPDASADPPLPRGGRYDEVLLKPGGADQLRRTLAELFAKTPASDCGRTNGRTAGRGCSFLTSSALGTSGNPPEQLPFVYASEAFSAGAVVDHLGTLATKFWDVAPEANVLQLKVPKDGRIIILGDTHGQLEDVLWIFFKYGPPSEKNWYLFNGDIVDRGSYALEILLLLFAYKRDCPEAVHITRGNHEDSSCILHYGFRSELESKFPEQLSAVWNTLTVTVFPRIPIAAILQDQSEKRKIGVLHGGVPVNLSKSAGAGNGDEVPAVKLIGGLTRVNRRRQTFQQLEEGDIDGRLLYNLLWADPADSEEEKKSASSRASKFVEKDTRAFCEANGLEFIVRSHEVPRNMRGAYSQHGGKCVTVFSASNYTGSVGNVGGVLVLRGDTFEARIFEHWAPPWAKLAEILRSEPNRGASPGGDNSNISNSNNNINNDDGLSGSSFRGFSSWWTRRGKSGTNNSAEGESNAAAEWEISLGLTPREGGYDLDALAVLPSPLVASSSSTASFFSGGVVRGQEPVGPREEAAAAARAQRAQFMTERLVEHKEELFKRLSAADPYCTGCIVKASWSRNLLEVLGPHCENLLTREVMEELWNYWGLSQPLKYVRFLHRFQIRDSPDDGSVLVDRIQAVTKLQAQLVNFSAINLEHLLDPNGDKTVTSEEFASFLPMFHVHIPPWQVAALYETMSSIVGQHPLTLDSSILCLSLISQDPPSLSSDSCAESAEKVGRAILAAGWTLPSVFRKWDTSGDGFLSISELEVGLKSWLSEQKNSHNDDAGEVEAQKVCCRLQEVISPRDKVSLFEFVRVVAPRRLTLELQETLIKEVLKHVWRCRPILLELLSRADPDATNQLPWEVFRQCVFELNSALETMGLHALNDIQVNVICEIAAAGSDTVRYEDFLRGLHVEDINVSNTSSIAPPTKARAATANSEGIATSTSSPPALLPGLGSRRRRLGG